MINIYCWNVCVVRLALLRNCPCFVFHLNVCQKYRLNVEQIMTTMIGCLGCWYGASKNTNHAWNIKMFLSKWEKINYWFNTQIKFEAQSFFKDVPSVEYDNFIHQIYLLLQLCPFTCIESTNAKNFNETNNSCARVFQKDPRKKKKEYQLFLLQRKNQCFMGSRKLSNYVHFP